MEDKLKAPVLTRRIRKKTRFRRSWYLMKKLIIRYIKSTPRLQIIFTNDKQVENFSDECHCNTLPSTYYLLQIGSYFSFGKFKRKNIFMSLVFPEESNLNIETFTFKQISGNKGLFCEEIRFNCGHKLRRVLFLKTKLRPYFRENDPMQKCIILFVRDYSVFSMLELLKTIRNWYPESNIPIWGGLMDRLNVCQRCFNKTHCTSAAEMVLMFISSPDMKVWNVTLDKTCNSMITIRQKLTTFKEKVELKLYSIALMYFSSRRIDKLDTIQIKAFQEIFPNIILYPIYGDASIGGETWVEIISTTFMEGQNTTFMILTYN